VVAGRLLEEFPAVQDTAALRVAGTEDHAADTCKTDRGGAHGARLKRDIEIAVGNALRPGGPAAVADGQDFGMGGGVGVFNGSVTGPGNNLAGFIVHEDGPDRHFVAVGGGLGLGHYI